MQAHHREAIEGPQIATEAEAAALFHLLNFLHCWEASRHPRFPHFGAAWAIPAPLLGWWWHWHGPEWRAQGRRDVPPTFAEAKEPTVPEDCYRAWLARVGRD